MSTSLQRWGSRGTRSLVVAGIMVAGWGMGPGPSRAAYGSPTEGHPMIGEAAPDFELNSVASGTVSLSEFRGSYLVIHFGASW